MKKISALLLCFLVLVSFSVPRAHADMDTGFEEIEGSLLSDLPPEPEAPEADDQPGSSWWKWGLGLLAVGAIGVAAGGGGGGGGDSTTGGATGTVSASW